MKLSEVCIKRPVFAWVLTLMMVLLGLVAGNRLAIRQNPKMEKNHVTVSVMYSGAGPEIIENQVTHIIEEAVAGVEGIDTIESKSDSEKSEVSLEIAEGINLDVATNDIRDKLSKWADRFPDAAQKPILTKAGSNEKSVVTLALFGDKINESELYAYAKDEISHALEAVPGVARIDVFGAGDYQMMISLDSQRMAYYNMTVVDVMTALRKQNVESPAGKIVNKEREYVVTTVADLQSQEEFDQIPVANRGENIIKLKDIGCAKLDKSDKKVVSKYNGENVVVIQIVSQSSANPIQVARGVKEKFNELQEHIPSNMKFCIAYDTTLFIERSLSEVYSTIIESILLVVFVVFMFLRSLRAAFVPLITIPISLIGSFFIMYLCDFSINCMTLMSMVLAIGLVVDDAIVILENIYKHLESGKGAMQAAIDGTKEVSFAVIAMTLTLCAVYAPVAMAQGLTGKYLKEFAVTLAGAVFLSGFVALTLSPMMCSRILGENKAVQIDNKIAEILRQILNKLDSTELIKKIEVKYTKLLDWALKNKKTCIKAALSFSIFGYIVYCCMPREQIPYQDMGIIGFEGHAPQTATIRFTQRYVEAIDKVIEKHSDVESRNFIITNPTFEGFAILQNRSNKTTEEVTNDIARECEEICGIDVRFSSGRGGSDDSSKVVMCVVRGNKSHRELKDITQNLINEIYDSKIVSSVRTTAKNEAEDYVIDIKRDKASAMGVDPRAISDVLSGLVQGMVVTKFKKDNKEHDVRVGIEEEQKRSPSQLNDIYVKSAPTDENKSGGLVSIAELVEVRPRSGPVSISRYNRARANTVTPILNDSTSLGEAIDIIRDLAKKTLPDDVFLEFIGETKRFLTESNTMLLIFVLALSFIYLVMAAQFESWRDPFIIMLTVPFTLVGGVLTLCCIKNGTINMYSNIGFLTLIGLITKHGILMVDFANKLVEQGKMHEEAIREACVRRLRPILMTTFAMVLGALPLALARGAGSEIRTPLGAVIVGGMTVGTVFTLLVVPVVYVYITSINRKRGRWRKRIGNICRS